MWGGDREVSFEFSVLSFEFWVSRVPEGRRTVARRFIAGKVQLPCVPEGRLNPGRVRLVPKIAFFKTNAVLL